MCFYKPELTEEDVVFLRTKDLVKKQLGGNSVRIYVLFENSSELASGLAVSGDTGQSYYLGSVYGKVAWSGHAHDAEIKALTDLDINSTHSGQRGTLYLIGSSGPCDSCKRALRKLCDSFPALQCKVLYLNPPEESLTQSTTIRYGWFGDKLRKIGSTSWHYHYLPSKNEQNPLSEEMRQRVRYGWTMIGMSVKNGGKFTNAPTLIPGLQLKKLAAETLLKEVRESLFQVQVACNTWCERRRFAHEDANTARDAVVRLYKLDEIQTTELDRRLKLARKETFNWFVPED